MREVSQVMVLQGVPHLRGPAVTAEDRIVNDPVSKLLRCIGQTSPSRIRKP